MKVLYFSKIGEKEFKYLKTLLDAEIEIENIPPDMKERIFDAPESFDAVIGARVPREFLVRAKKLKYFVIPFVGIPPQDFDNLNEFSHLTVINSHFNARYVAEHAFALLLAAAKHIIPIHEKLKQGDWSPRYAHEWSTELANRTLLIIGFGCIGRTIAEMAKPFHMKIEAIKRIPQTNQEVDFVGTLADLPKVLPEADFIVLALPGTHETENLIGKKEFDAMKQGVYIVNVGRGPVINENAFYEALKSGKIAGAALDTWWVYPENKEARTHTFPAHVRLQEFDNVIFSPHRGSHVVGREIERMRDLADILNSINRGKPKNVIDVHRGY